MVMLVVNFRLQPTVDLMEMMVMSMEVQTLPSLAIPFHCYHQVLQTHPLRRMRFQCCKCLTNAPWAVSGVITH